MTDKNALAVVLSAEFEPSEVLHFEGRGGRIFDYIEDETVMDRDDLALGIGAVSYEFSPVTDTCVKGRKTVAWPDGTTSWYEDFGYSTKAALQPGEVFDPKRHSPEPFKEAVSDCIRRLGRYTGIARYLYRKHDSVQSGGRATPPPARPPARPAGTGNASVTVVRDEAPEFAPNEWDEPQEFAPIGGKAAPANVPSDHCPIHDTAWTGNPGDLWHGPKGVVEGGYCRHPDNIKNARRAG